MIKVKRLWRAAVCMVLAVAAVVSLGIVVHTRTANAETAAYPDLSGMEGLINENTEAQEWWSADVSPVYSYNAEAKTADFTADPIPAAASGMTLSLRGDAADEYRVHRFKTGFYGAFPDIGWTSYMFRTDSVCDDFSAICFRATGQIGVVERVGGKFYADAAVFPNLTPEPGIAVQVNDTLNAMANDAVLDITIESDQDFVRVYLAKDGAQELIFEAELTNKIAPASGIVQIGATDMCGGHFSDLQVYGTVLEQSAKPDLSGYAAAIGEKSTASVLWATPEMKAEYAWGDGGASYKTVPAKDGDVANSSGSLVSFTQAVSNEYVVTFNTKLYQPYPDLSWVTTVFRSDRVCGNFIALAFRGTGEITLMERYDGKFYTNDRVPIYEGEGITFGGYPLYYSEQLRTMDKAAEISVTIRSDAQSVTVWIGDTVVYAADLLHAVEPGFGTVNLTTQDFVSGEYTNLNCYAEDYTKDLNTVSESSIVYSPFGGGGASSELTETGATLDAGSSVDGVAVISGPKTTGRAVHTFSMTLDTPASNIYDQYTFIIRATDDFEDYLAISVRRKFGHIMLRARVDGWNLSYSPLEPFEDKNIWVFPVGTVMDTAVDLEPGTVLNFTVISDQNGLQIFNNNALIYSVVYSELKVIEGSDNGLDVSKLPQMLGSIPTTTAMMKGSNGYAGATFSNINCYIEEKTSDDTVSYAMLSDISYKGTKIEGFSSGAFEHDIVISSSETIDKNALSYTLINNEAKADPIAWSVNKNTGFEEAKIKVSYGDLSFTYTVTFEVRDEPQPVVEPEDEDLNAVPPGNNTALIVGCSVGGACLVAAAAVAAVLIVRRKNKKQG